MRYRAPRIRRFPHVSTADSFPPMKKFVLAPVLAGVAMFVFGAVYWMSPFPYKALTPVTDNAATGQALSQIFPATGTYLIPGPDIKDTQLLTELYQRGPSAEVQFIKEGHSPMEAGVFIKGFLHYVVVALLLAVLLDRFAAGRVVRYASLVQFSGLVGAFGAVFISLTDPIWWHHPWGWHLVQAIYVVLASLVAGLVLGRFFLVRPTIQVSR